MDHANIKNDECLVASNLAPCERIPTADLHNALQLCTLTNLQSLSVRFQSNLQSRDDGRVAAARDRDNLYRRYGPEEIR